MYLYLYIPNRISRIVQAWEGKKMVGYVKGRVEGSYGEGRGRD